jgi:hypothetical protein
MSQAKAKVVIGEASDIIEIEYWCAKHLSYEWANTYFSPNPFVRGLERRCFLFATEADAMLFMLKWGGTLSH